MKNTKYNSPEFIKEVKSYCTGLSVILKSLFPEGLNNLQFFTRLPEKKKVEKYVSKTLLPITEDRDYAGFVLYHMIVNGESFDEAYEKIFLNRELKSVIFIVCDNLQSIECTECGGEGTVECEECDGYGRTRDEDEETECEECGGTGLANYSCGECDGNGISSIEAEFLTEQYIVIDDLSTLPKHIEDLHQFEVYCDANNIPYSYHSSVGLSKEFREEYSDAKSIISNEGISIEPMSNDNKYKSILTIRGTILEKGDIQKIVNDLFY